MFWILIALGILAALVLTPAIVGLFLTEDFSGRAEETYPASPENVWDALADFRKHPICPEARRIDRLDGDADGLPAWREDLGPSAVRVRTAEARPHERLVRDLEDEVVPMRARWTYELKPAAAGTTVTLTQTGVVERGTWHVPIFRFMLKVMNGQNEGLRKHLRKIKVIS